MYIFPCTILIAIEFLEFSGLDDIRTYHLNLFILIVV